MNSFTSKLLVAATACLFISQSSAHTWNEQLAVIGSSGNFTGAYGYTRGFVPRSGNFGDWQDEWLLPSNTSGRNYINASDALCAPWQRTQIQTDGWPRLQVSPGSFIAMKYLENGHVTLPQNQPGKPDNRGTVYVYATNQPIPNETLVNVLYWNADGSGGDKRGRLLTMQNFDDLRCHQINDGALSLQRQQQFPDVATGTTTSTELWCETDVHIPTDTSFIQVGKTLTLYWVWDWPYLPNGPTPMAQEWYTSCSDIDIVSDDPSGPVSNLDYQQDPNLVAVSDYKSRTVNPSYTIPSYFNWPGISAEKYVPAATTIGIKSSNKSIVKSSTTFVTNLASTTATSSTSATSMSAVTFSTSAPSSQQAPTSLTFGSETATLSKPSITTTIQNQVTQSALTLYSVFTVTGIIPANTDIIGVEGTFMYTFSRPSATSTVTSAAPTVKVKRNLGAGDVIDAAMVDGGHRFRIPRMQGW